MYNHFFHWNLNTIHSHIIFLIFPPKLYFSFLNPTDLVSCRKKNYFRKNFIQKLSLAGPVGNLFRH